MNLIDQDVLKLLRRGPVKMAAAEALMIAPATLKNAIKRLKLEGFEIETTWETEGYRSSIYHLRSEPKLSTTFRARPARV